MAALDEHVERRNHLPTGRRTEGDHGSVVAGSDDHPAVGRGVEALDEGVDESEFTDVAQAALECLAHGSFPRFRRTAGCDNLTER